MLASGRIAATLHSTAGPHQHMIMFTHRAVYGNRLCRLLSAFLENLLGKLQMLVKPKLTIVKPKTSISLCDFRRGGSPSPDGSVLTVLTVRFSRLGLHGSGPMVRFAPFASHGSVITVRFSRFAHGSLRFGSHGSVHTVRFSRFGSHGLVHTVGSEIENRNRKSVECVIC